MAPRVTKLIEVLTLAGLTLPGVTVYRCWPEFVWMYAGVAILILLSVAWFISKGTRRDAS